MLFNLEDSSRASHANAVCLHDARGAFPAGHGQLANTISPEFIIDNLT